MKNERMLVWMAVALLTAGCAKKKNSQVDHAAAAPDSSRTAVAAPAPVATLGRGPWTWVSTVTPTARVTAQPDHYTVVFLPDSTVRVLLDCNRGSGRYHADGHNLQIGPLAVTRMMCPPGTMDATFAQELGGVRSWSMQADTLMLDLVADSGTMRLTR